MMFHPPYLRLREELTTLNMSCNLTQYSVIPNFGAKAVYYLYHVGRHSNHQYLEMGICVKLSSLFET